MAGRAVKGVALAFTGRTREAIEILQDVRREIVAGDLLWALPSVDIPLGAAMIHLGELRLTRALAVRPA